MFVSYARNFEDVMLHRALQNVTTGFFIDIGARDPHAGSVSRAFVELGWRGANVEPSSTFAAKLKAYRPTDDLIEAVIGCSSEDVIFYEIPETGLSTTLKQLAEEHRGAGYPIKERKVRSLPLDDLLDMYSDRDIHWLRIDTGGAEQDILNSWISSNARPWIVVIEAVEPVTRRPAHRHWEAHILQLGYRFVYFDGINRFYISVQRPELTKYFDHGPSCVDDFTLATTCPMNAAASAEIAVLKTKLLQHKAVILAHRDLCKALGAESKRLAQSESQHFQRLVLEMLDSTSWRVTAPLRRLSNAIHLLVNNPSEFIAIMKAKLAAQKAVKVATAKPGSTSPFGAGSSIRVSTLDPASVSEPKGETTPSTPDSSSLTDINPSLQVLRDLERAMSSLTGDK